MKTFSITLAIAAAVLPLPVLVAEQIKMASAAK